MQQEFSTNPPKQTEDNSAEATAATHHEAAHRRRRLIALESTPRKITWGEKALDLFNYIGFALIGNEIAGTWLTQSADKGFLKPWYSKFAEWFTRHAHNPSVPKYASSGRLPIILVAITTGNFMVPFIKYFEDRKSEIVRGLNRWHYGDKKVDTDPELIHAHQDMDAAPKQSWGSLWKGRMVTMISAIVVDFFAGWQDAISTKIFKNSPTYQRFSSMDRIAGEAADKWVKVFKTPEVKKANVHGWVKQGTWLFTLSTTLTLLFYVTTKLFAKNRDERIERRQMQAGGHAPQRDDAEGVADLATTTSAPDAAEKPPTKVRYATHASTLHSTPLAQGV